MNLSVAVVSKSNVHGPLGVREKKTYSDLAQMVLKVLLSVGERTNCVACN